MVGIGLHHWSWVCSKNPQHFYVNHTMASLLSSIWKSNSASFGQLPGPQVLPDACQLNSVFNFYLNHLIIFFWKTEFSPVVTWKVDHLPLEPMVLGEAIRKGRMLVSFDCSLVLLETTVWESWFRQGSARLQVEMGGNRSLLREALFACDPQSKMSGSFDILGLVRLNKPTSSVHQTARKQTRDI